jgi:uncharacterized protein YggE
LLRIHQSIIVLAMSATFISAASPQTIEVNRENKTIAISTADEATATADIAAITVGFESSGPESQSTYIEAGKLSQSIIRALHQAGVGDKQIESSQQGMVKNTEFDPKLTTPEERKKMAYTFSQSWQISVATKQASDVIRAAIAAGANKTGDIEWRLSDRKALQAKAAEVALIKARSVAAHMAEGLGVKLGTLVYASNQTPIARLFGAGGGGTATVESAEVTATRGEPVPLPALEIRPQTIREEATVYAVFAIE